MSGTIDALDDLATLRSLLAEATALGTRFRLHGYDVEIAGLDSLPEALQGALRRHHDSGLLWIYLGGEELDAPSLNLAEELGVKPVLIESRHQARQAVRLLTMQMRRHDGVLGCDIETAPLPEYRKPLWCKLNKDGCLAARQPEPDRDDDAGLSPHTADVASLQLYAGAEHCYVFREEALRLMLTSHWLRRQTLIIHGSTFELKFLGDGPFKVEDTLQGAGLLHGLGFGGETRRLDNIARVRLRGLEVPKGLQRSDWDADRQSPGQLAYAACDAVVAFELWPRMQHDLRRKGRWRAYELQIDAAPAVADMEKRGIVFDRTAHRQQIDSLSEALADARGRFAELAGRAPTSTQAEIRNWLKDTLEPSEFAGWPRTEKEGLLSVSVDALKAVTYREDARAMIDIINNEKLLSTFGPSLADKISPATGRLHPSFNLAATKAGRFSSRNPNFQQFPTDKRAAGFRDAVIARPGHVLIGADYAQIELRALAEIYRNRALRQVFAAGIDPHAKTAAEINHIPLDTLMEDLRQGVQAAKDLRGDAKPVNFGIIYGMRARGLAGYAYSSYGVVMSERKADEYIRVFFNTYAPLEDDLKEHARLCQRRGHIEIGAGRVVEASWEKYGLSYQQCCNIPIQGVSADCMLRALKLVYDEFRGCGIRGGLIATIHDEILAEVHEDDAEGACALLEACMLAAFADTFPHAALDGVVTAKIGRTWGGEVG